MAETALEETRRRLSVWRAELTHMESRALPGFDGWTARSARQGEVT